jgi:hypothetical protein
LSKLKPRLGKPQEIHVLALHNQIATNKRQRRDTESSQLSLWRTGKKNSYVKKN